MRLGVVLPSFMYSPERKRLAKNAFQSLMKTDTLLQTTKLLLLVKEGTAPEYVGYLNGLKTKFDVVLRTDEGLVGTEQTLAYGTQLMFLNYGVEYVIWMGDDSLFHPLWLWQLENLIKRHPAAKSWSVYRSAYEWFHKTLDDSGEDVRVRSICGHGMTFTRKEWQEWGIKWEQGVWCAPDGDTLDLYHFWERPGERWVTKKSYIAHTGREGVHCTKDTPEFAKDFQMVGEES